MLYRDIIKTLSSRTGLTAVSVDQVVTELARLMSEEIRRSGRVRIAPIGIFETRIRGPRIGRNPSTGDPIDIEGRRTIGYRPATKMRSRTFR